MTSPKKTTPPRIDPATTHGFGGSGHTKTGLIHTHAGKTNVHA